MAEEQVFHPEEIAETPFPGQDIPVIVQQTQSSGDVTTPTTTKTSSFPTRKIATELIGTVLNTKSRKILGEFQLEQSGGIKVGDFKDGVSGEVALTRAGLVAKNKAGLTTFGLDGDTGDAVFKGEVQAGSVVSGEVTVYDSGSFNLNSGADIILSSKPSDFSQILFTSDETQDINSALYYDRDANIVKFTSETDEVGFRFGNTTSRIQGFEIYAYDGLYLRCYTVGGHYFQLEFSPVQLLISYDGSSKMKVDTSGNLYITGTITQNWVP